MACQSPIFVPQGLRDVPVPCGKCPPCIKRRVDSWVFRLLQEEKVSTNSHFITLTYDTPHVPISPNGWLTLTRGQEVIDGKTYDLCCFTKFMKRLRKLCPGFKLKYYACGEYGSENKRPHWHAIVFNVPDDKLYSQAWSLDGVQFGSVVVGQVSNDSIAYCCKYMNSSAAAGLYPNWVPYVGRDDRVPEFSLMSKGMGVNFVTDAAKRFYNADLSRQYITVHGGNKIAMPRYYKGRLFGDKVVETDSLTGRKKVSYVVPDDISEELHILAEASSIEVDRKNRELHARVSHGTDYGDFVESQRKARIASFKRTLKSRKL